MSRAASSSCGEGCAAFLDLLKGAQAPRKPCPKPQIQSASKGGQKHAEHLEAERVAQEVETVKAEPAPLEAAREWKRSDLLECKRSDLLNAVGQSLVGDSDLEDKLEAEESSQRHAGETESEDKHLKAEEATRRHAEETERERLCLEAEETTRRHAEETEMERTRLEAEEAVRRHAEETERERLCLEAEEAVRRDAEETERERTRLKVEEAARRHAEETERERKRLEAEEAIRRHAEETKRVLLCLEAEEQKRAKAEEVARRHAEEVERRERKRLDAAEGSRRNAEVPEMQQKYIDAEKGVEIMVQAPLRDYVAEFTHIVEKAQCEQNAADIEVATHKHGEETKREQKRVETGKVVRRHADLTKRGPKRLAVWEVARKHTEGTEKERACLEIDEATVTVTDVFDVKTTPVTSPKASQNMGVDFADTLRLLEEKARHEEEATHRRRSASEDLDKQRDEEAKDRWERFNRKFADQEEEWRQQSEDAAKRRKADQDSLANEENTFRIRSKERVDMALARLSKVDEVDENERSKNTERLNEQVEKEAERVRATAQRRMEEVRSQFAVAQKECRPELDECTTKASAPTWTAPSEPSTTPSTATSTPNQQSIYPSKSSSEVSETSGCWPCGLQVFDMQLQEESFDPNCAGVHQALLQQLGASDDALIKAMEGFSGGLNEGIWFLSEPANVREVLALKLVRGTRQHSEFLTDAENLLRLSESHPNITEDSQVSFPFMIIHISTPNSAKYDLLVMRKAPGQSFADHITSKRCLKQMDTVQVIMEKIGVCLQRFHTNYGGQQHGDFQPSNIFYDEQSDIVTLIDLGGIGVPTMETDSEHFAKSMRLCYDSYGPEIMVDGMASFFQGLGAAGPAVTS